MIDRTCSSVVGASTIFGMKKIALTLSILAIFLGLSSEANAQSTRGLWISGGAEVLRVNRSTLNAPPVIRDTTFTTVYLGLTGGDVGIGYQLGQYVLLGGRFGASLFAPEDADALFVGHLSAHIEVLFSAGKVRPFMFIDPGLMATGQSSQFGSQNYVGFRGEIGGGAHLFLTDSFSISPYGAFRYQDITTGPSGFGTETNQTDFSFVVGAMISGWVWKK